MASSPSDVIIRTDHITMYYYFIHPMDTHKGSKKIIYISAIYIKYSLC